MKTLAAFLLLTSVALAQTRIDFDPYQNESRTIFFDRSGVTSDVTVPEGVGYIYIYNSQTGRGAVEYVRKQPAWYYRPYVLLPGWYTPYMP